jgi:predicted outer membrane repeat protein
MAIEFGSFIGNINNGIYSVPFLNMIFTSVLYTSIILSILLIVILLVIQPLEDSSFELFKIFVYTLITNIIIFSVHSSIVSNKYKEQYSADKSYDFINNINDKTGGAIYAEDTIKVVPQFKSYENAELNMEAVYDEPKVETISDMLDDIEKKI